MTLGECIKEYRDSHYMSQRQFAEECGLSNAYISILEKNINPKTGEAPVPTYGVYKKVADAMGISAQELMERATDSFVSIGSRISVDPSASLIHPEVLAILNTRAECDTPQEERDELLHLFRAMCPADREKLLDYARYIVDTYNRRK